MGNVIEIQDLRKSFGKLKAVNGLSFSVPKGSLYGFLGPNGSGKSTTLRVLSGLARQDSGKVYLFGKESNSDILLRDRIGMMIEGPAFYGYLNARQNMKLVARLHSKPVSKNRINECLELVNLHDRANDLVKNYSQGMKQRLGLALALIHQPELLILDEPSNGLDPEGNEEMWQILCRLIKDSNATILVSSHLLYEIEQFCSHVVVIRKGQQILEGQVSDLLNVEDHIVDVSFINNEEKEKARQLLKRTEWIQSATTKGQEEIFQLRIHLGPNSLEKLARLLNENNIITPTSIPKQNTLRDLFMKLTTDSSNEID